MKELSHSPEPKINFSIKYNDQKIPVRKKITQRYTGRSQTIDIADDFSPNPMTHSLNTKSKLETSTDLNTEQMKHSQSISGRFNLNKKHKNKNKSRLLTKNQSLATAIQTEERQFSKIPIEFYDQKDNGPFAYPVKGRIVYKGYAPKNSYYYLKAINEIDDYRKSLKKNSLISGYQLEFDSKFQCGNLSTVIRQSKHEYLLYMRQDTNTHGLRQWFYFQVICNKSIKIKFKIYKYTKRYSLYAEGMKPYVKVNKEEWHQAGQNVKYEYDPQGKCYYLYFQFSFHLKDVVQFATMPPYSYSNLMNYLQLLKESHPKAHVKNVGYSLGGLEIPLVMIKQSELQKSKFYFNDVKKHAIVILCRTHPAQTCSNFTLESLIHEILSNETLLQVFDYFIFPMVNPDGVFLGNHRTSIVGMDLNRKFNTFDKQSFPQVDLVKEYVGMLQKLYEIEFIFDLHGHSARKNIFAYGEQHEIGSKQYLKSRILPKILSQSISTFKYKYCLFREVKQKKHTARVYFSQKYKINAITFEQSYGLIDNGPIGTQNWRNFGVALAESLISYLDVIRNGQSSLSEYLKDEIKEQTIIQSLRLEKQKLLLEAQLEQKRKTQSICNEMVQQSNIKEVHQNKPEIEDQSLSVASSQLSSGDQSLQFKEEELQELKKQIRLGCLREGVKRELLNVSDKKIELKNYVHPSEQYILHQQKMAIMPRILKMQMKNKVKDQRNLEKGEGAYTYIIRRKNSIDNINRIKEVVLNLPSIYRLMQ